MRFAALVFALTILAAKSQSAAGLAPGAASPMIPNINGKWWRVEAGGATQYRWKDNQ